MGKTFRKKLRKTKRYYKGGGNYKNRKKTKKNKRKRLKGGGDKIEKIDSFNTNISFFIVLFYLKSSDDNAKLDNYRGSDKLPIDNYREYINQNDMNKEIQYFHKYLINNPSDFSFKYNDKYSYYKLSVKDKFLFLCNPQTIFNFNNYHAIVGYNHNISMDNLKIKNFTDFLNAEDKKQGSMNKLFKGETKYYSSLGVDDLTQNNIDEIEKKQSGGGIWNKTKKFGRNISKMGSKISQSYRTSSIGHDTETSKIYDKFNLMKIESKVSSYLIFQSENSNVNTYNLIPNKTIICPLDILIGFDHGCKMGICRNRNWNNNLQVSSESNGFEGTKRDFEHFKKTELEYYQNLNKYDEADKDYYEKEINEIKEKNKKIIDEIEENKYNIIDLGLSVVDEDKNTYQESQDKDSTKIQKEINEFEEKIKKIIKDYDINIESKGMKFLKSLNFLNDLSMRGEVDQYEAKIQEKNLEKSNNKNSPEQEKQIKEIKKLEKEKKDKEKIFKHRKTLLSNSKTLEKLYKDLSENKENNNSADLQKIDTSKVGDLNPIFWISRKEWIINKNYVNNTIFEEWISNLKINDKNKSSDESSNESSDESSNESSDEENMDGGGNEELLERYKNYFFFIINDDQNNKDVILNGEEDKEFIVIDGSKLN